jgi:hypothetical protein
MKQRRPHVTADNLLDACLLVEATGPSRAIRRLERQEPKLASFLIVFPCATRTARPGGAVGPPQGGHPHPDVCRGDATCDRQR